MKRLSHESYSKSNINCFLSCAYKLFPVVEIYTSRKKSEFEETKRIWHFSENVMMYGRMAKIEGETNFSQNLLNREIFHHLYVLGITIFSSNVPVVS